MPPMATWNYLTKPVTIVPPDNDQIIPPPPLVSSGYPEMIVEVRFKVFNGPTQIGPIISGYPQERIRRPQLPPTHPMHDSGWQGDVPGIFEWTGQYILDKKIVGAGGQFEIAPGVFVPWSGIQNLSEFDNFYQQNRLRIKDCHGNYQDFYFLDRHFRKTKFGNQAWKLEELTP